MKLAGKAAATSAGLSALFVVTYGFCNWVTGLRAGVGSVFFGFERHIPFVPVMIVPYLSIDLFFVAAPFLARSERELRTLAWRIGMAIGVAGLFFLLMPLKFGFARPQVSGVLGVIFNGFRSVDAPFNEFPSLHIALWVILLDVYFRRSAGRVRWLLVAWLGLIALSPLLTYQHHLIDIVGGLALGTLCLHLVGDEPRATVFAGNRRVGFYYAGAAVLTAALAFVWVPWTWVLLWPALSLALAACGYWFLGPGIYRKERATLAWTTWVLLWPVLAGQWLSLVYYARRCAAYDRLTETLWIGRRLTEREARQARGDGVKAVIDLTAEFAEAGELARLDYLQLPVLDLTAPTPGQMEEAVEFIRRHDGVVYLHCKIGYSRTAAVAGAHLLATGRAKTVEGAIKMMRAARPGMVVRPEAMEAMKTYWNDPRPHETKRGLS